jgi:hypothetical protein
MSHKSKMLKSFWDFGYETTDETKRLNGYALKIRLKQN